MLLVLAVVLQGRPRVEGGSLLYAWLLLIALVISDIAALVTGLVSIIKTNERSILAFSAVVVTGLFTLFAFYMFIAESTYKP